MTTIVKELGYFGNIWVRSHYLLKKGDNNGGGHKHHFDHVTLLAKGSVEVEIEGYEPKTFKGPTFIVIKKEHKHKFTALEDDTIYYCVFALRDVDGEVTDIYSGDNSPYGAAPDDAHVVEALKSLDEKTTDEN
jgi:hypothetical protein